MMDERRYRYWHKRFEFCKQCRKMLPINRLGECPNHHSVYPDYHEIVPVNNLLRRGGLAYPLKATTAAQAANLLSEWNKQDSWRLIAHKLLDRHMPYRNGHNKRLLETSMATTLCAFARRESDSRDVYYLLNIKPPKKYVVAFHLHNEGDAAALRRLFDAHGSNRREIARKLIDGELVIRESGK